MERIIRKIVIGLVFWAGILPGGALLSAQEYLHRGDSLHRRYQFEDALSAYLAALRDARSLEAQQQVYGRIDQAQNALNMTGACANPKVVASQTFSRQDFFLYYPLENKAWRSAPNPLDTLGGSFPLYLPENARQAIFSAPDGSGARNLCFSEDRDSCWGAPTLLDERLMSAGNEIFPILSADGNSLYFSSDGLYGMGGYDLYVSRKDPESGRWGTPENLGIPFSSPGDDFLVMDTEDRKYTLFASNRDCSTDSVCVYVLEYETLPVHTPIRDPEALRRLAELRPVQDPTRMDNAAAVSGLTVGNDNTRAYRAKTEQARALRDSIYRYERDLDALRSVFPSTEGESRAALTRIISEKEESLFPLRQALDGVNGEIRRIEQSFLKGGVVRSVEDRPVVGAAKGYTFTKKMMGGELKGMRVAWRTAAPDEAFQVSPVGHFAEPDSFPEGLVFQIRLFTGLRHATLDDIHGLSPVYERLGADLRYGCYAGIFRSYQAALQQLNTVRALGFREAVVTAFRDGRAEDLDTARQEAP